VGELERAVDRILSMPRAGGEAGLNGCSPQIVVATPYREGSVLAIARRAASRGQLARFYATLYAANLLAATRCVPFAALRQRLARELGRHSFAGVPPGRVETVARLPELAYVVARRLPRGEPLAGRLMYEAKERFDQAVAQRLMGGEWDAVVGMYASAELTLREARASNRLGVLNFVGSHPLYQNRFLTELGSLRNGDHELVSPQIARRVERELETASLVLVPSLFVARQLEEVGLPKERVAVEPYGVDLSAFSPPARRDRQGRRGGVIRCLYVGQISHRKGVRVLVEAARRLHNRPIEFVLVGPMVSPEVLRNPPDNLHYWGPTAHGGVAEIMHEADLFALPSLEDAYPLVTLEAMASGLPVIVSDHAGTSELITHGEDGLVIPAGDVTALVQAIERLFQDNHLRAAMGAAARRRVEGGHSWVDYADRVLDLTGERTVA
jgi:glycosyltransferase involved in cell wall biosynthesis